MNRTLAAVALTIGAALPAISTAHAATSVLTFSNDGSYAVAQIYVRPSDQPVWGAEMLRGATIAPGAAANLQFERADSQCLFDVWVVYDAGYASAVDMVDMCGGAVTVTDSMTMSPEFAEITGP